ncbi:MAG: hypothetical protein DWQ02_22475 [Bacteroidetes bacterium]|nr:MAG: hypothetical protein DWQ02_22475 [Bacteroidota bacterium]
MITKNKYQPLVNISFRHEYYFASNQGNLIPGGCSDFVCTISDFTKNQLKNLGIQFRPFNKGFELLAKTDDLEFLESFNKPIHIELIYRNPLFLHFTKIAGLPFSEIFERNKVFFFSNRHPLNRFVTTSNNFVSNKDFIEKKTSFLKLKKALVKKNINKAIFDFQTNIISNLELKFTPPLNGEAIPLKNLPEGVYSKVQYFDRSNTIIGEQKFPNQGAFLTNNPDLVGVIEVYLNRISEKYYTINFNRKKAFWNYLIVANKGAIVKMEYKKPKETKIKMIFGEGDIEFQKLSIENQFDSYKQFLKKVEKTLSPSDNELLIYRSDKKLPISEILNTGIIIKKKNRLIQKRDTIKSVANPIPSNVLNIEEDKHNHHIFSLIDVSN